MKAIVPLFNLVGVVVSDRLASFILPFDLLAFIMA